MFELKIIILFIIIKILSFILSQYYTDKHVNKILTYDEKNYTISNIVCITPAITDFMIYWIKFTIEMIDYSKAILSKDTMATKYYIDLEKTRDELVNLFSKVHKDHVDNFKNLINEQISLKMNLCNAILYNDTTKVNIYSQKLVENTDKLSNFFNQFKQKVNVESKVKLQDKMSSQTDKYIKSIQFINKTNDNKIKREIVLGSIETVKLLFI
jgi:hypothetical protein